MKNIYITLISLALILTSCGGTGYTINEEEALEQLEQIAKDEEEGQKTFLEDLKSWKEEKDKILKEYSGKESKLLKKAKKDNEDALDALADLRALEIKVQLAYFDMEKEIERRELVWYISQRDIISLMDEDDQEDWYEDTEDIWEKRRKAKNKFDKKARKVWDSQDSYGGNASGIASAEEAAVEEYYDESDYYDEGDYYEDEGYYDYGEAAKGAPVEYYDDHNRNGAGASTEARIAREYYMMAKEAGLSDADVAKAIEVGIKMKACYICESAPGAYDSKMTDDCDQFMDEYKSYCSDTFGTDDYNAESDAGKKVQGFRNIMFSSRNKKCN